MIQAISNNFGVESIQFKDYQTPDYIILNARIEFNTSDPGYQAADHLEIKVPDLSLDRSAEGGVFLRYIDEYDSYSSHIVEDGGTVLRSWIKDKNTICIEKLDVFDEYEEQILYFQTMYVQKHKDGLAVKSEEANIKMIPGVVDAHEGDHHSIVTDHWVFWMTGLKRVASQYLMEDFDIALQNMPEDVDIVIPQLGGPRFNDRRTTAAQELRIVGGHLKNVRMTTQWDNTSNPFIFGFFVRG